MEALKICAAEHEKNDEATPSGEVWPECLASVFRTGLHVRVVAYSNDDRESREAWNTAKHDEERNSVRWSTLYRAAKGMHPTVQDELKQYPDLKGAYVWDSPYLIQSPTHAHLVLSPYSAVNALRILAVATEIEPFSAKRLSLIHI